MLCKELDEIADKREMSAGDRDAIQKLTSSIKNTYKIEMAEDGGYSRDGEWEADMRGTYGRGSSYRGRRRDAMGRYSRTDAREHMRAQVENSIGIVTALTPYIGYEQATELAQDALQTGRSVYKLALAKGLLTREALEEILKPERLTRPRKFVPLR